MTVVFQQNSISCQCIDSNLPNQLNFWVILVYSRSRLDRQVNSFQIDKKTERFVLRMFIENFDSKLLPVHNEIKISEIFEIFICAKFLISVFRSDFKDF